VNIEMLPVDTRIELGHGLGFSTPTSGAPWATSTAGFPGIWDKFPVRQLATPSLGSDDRGAARRSAVNDGNLVWTAPR
jgi:hypothetical protein